MIARASQTGTGTRAGRRLGRAALAGGAGLMLLLVGSVPGSAGNGASTAQARWERWQRMSRADRSAFVAQYDALSRRPDADQALAAASEFAALPPERRERLRELNALVERAVAEQPPVKRRWLESLPGDAQAVELMRLLRSDYPEQLKPFLPASGH